MYQRDYISNQKQPLKRITAMFGKVQKKICNEILVLEHIHIKDTGYVFVGFSIRCNYHVVLKY